MELYRAWGCVLCGFTRLTATVSCFFKISDYVALCGFVVLQQVFPALAEQGYKPKADFSMIVAYHTELHYYRGLNN